MYTYIASEGDHMNTSRRLATAAAAGSLLLVAGCASDASSNESEAGVDAYSDMVLVGSSQGGSGYNFMVAASRTFNQELGMNTSVQAGGTQENALLLSSGDIDMGITNPSAYMSAAEVDSIDDTNLRTLTNMFVGSALIVVPKDSPADSLEDLVGERIAIGIPGGSEYPLFYAAIECLGMSEDDFEAQPIGKEEASEAYRSSSIDAWLAEGTNPTPMIAEVLQSRRGGRIIGLGEKANTCLAEDPAYAEGEIPAGTYPGQDETIATTDEWFYLTVSSDFGEEAAYELAKTLDENHDSLVSAFPEAKYSTVENTAEFQGFPLHPGVERYLEEKGAL
jgi:TRAP transporter TAXI family solute receptor